VRSWKKSLSLSDYPGHIKTDLLCISLFGVMLCKYDFAYIEYYVYLMLFLIMNLIVLKKEIVKLDVE
jgi:hypothetical protein